MFESESVCVVLSVGSRFINLMKGLLKALSELLQLETVTVNGWRADWCVEASSENFFAFSNVLALQSQTFD